MKKFLLFLFVTGHLFALGQNIDALKAEAQAATGVEKAQKYNQLAQTYQQAGNWVQAEITARQAVQFSRQAGQNPTTIASLNTLGRVLARIGKYAPADYNLKEALALARRENDPQLIMNSYEALAYLNKTRRRAGLELKYERLYKAMQDSLAQISIDQKIADLEQKNVTDADARAAEVASAQQAEKAAKTKLASYLTIAGIIVAAALAAIAGIFVFFQRKLRAQTKKNKTQQERFAGIVRAQELEKVSTVSFLHNGVEDQLTEAQKALKNIMENENGLPDTDDLIPVAAQVKAARESAADASFAILPRLLLDKGIAPALQELIKRTDKATPSEVSFRSTPLFFSLTQDTQIIVYRTMHDLLSFVVNNSKADIIDVFINQDNKEYTFELKHNGLGWEEDELYDQEAIHWDSVLSKISFLGGKLKVIKKEPRGNEFKIHIPEQKIAAEEG